MKILVCGGRNFGEFNTTKGEPRDRDEAIAERKAFKVAMDFYNPTYIIQGAAKGADRMAILWAEKFGVEHSGQEFTADWSDGRGGGYKRNKRMMDEGKPELVVSFPGGTGTAMMMRISRTAGVPVCEISVNRTSSEPEDS